MRIELTNDGAEALEEFSKSIRNAYEGILEDTKSLATEIDSISDMLGVISEDILDLLAEIYADVEHVEEPVDNLCIILNKTASAIRDYVADRIRK